MSPGALGWLKGAATAFGQQQGLCCANRWGGGSQITQALYHHEVLRYLRLFMSAVISFSGTQTGNWQPLPFLIPSGIPEACWLNTASIKSIRLHSEEAANTQTHTYIEKKSERFGIATETFMLWFCVTPIIMAVGSVATFQIRVG